MTLVLEQRALPRWRSTRDGRDRLDLVTDAVDLDASLFWADRIRYRPGDTAAKHFHVGCDQVFVVLEGRGLLYVDGEGHRLEAGATAIVHAHEVHWFVNDGDAEFSFVEFWSPPPQETVWITDDT